MMDRSAIEAIQESAAFDITDLSNTDVPAVIIPHNSKLESLEHLSLAPERFKAKFSTNIASEFITYCIANENNDSAIYIDPLNMSAIAYFDHGSPKEPAWAEHSANLNLLKTPAFNELIQLNNAARRQQEMIDFFMDWKENIIFFDEKNEAIEFQTAINRFRKLTVKTARSADNEQGNFNNKLSAMESIEIASGNDKLPVKFSFFIRPYNELKSYEITCNLRAIANEKTVSIKYRIEQLKLIVDEFANEFKDFIEKSLNGKADIYIGTIKLR